LVLMIMASTERLVGIEEDESGKYISP
jgi:hypothetical protein